MKHLLFALTLLISFDAYAFGRHRVMTDQSMPVVLANDATALAEGCGQQPSPLGMFCRQTEGDAANKSIFFIGPPAQCDRANCVFIKVFDNHGALIWGEAIAKGATRIEAPWWKLLGCADMASCKFQKDARGTWTFNTWVFWKDENGNENQSKSEGEIVLRVLAKDYVPLNAVANDPNFVWSWIDNGMIYKVTSGLRAYAAKVTQ